MIQVAICDENNKTLEKLEKLIKNTLGNEVSVSTHDNVFSLVTYVCDERKGKLDAVYIDINAGQKGGIVAAESLQKEYPNIKIIFLSDDIERAKDIFRINPIYFLTRPYEEDYVKDSLYKIIQIVDEDSAELLTIGNPESKKGDSVVLLKDIYYIESQKRVINIIMMASVHITTNWMKLRRNLKKISCAHIRVLSLILTKSRNLLMTDFFYTVEL